MVALRLAVIAVGAACALTFADGAQARGPYDGAWAGSVSGPGLPPIRLAAIADANVALAEDGARRYGYEKALPSWEAVAEDPSIDAVSIVVGNALHRPIAEALVAAGKHVLCEKPLAGSMADARAMVELENSGRVVTAVGYTYRRSPAVAVPLSSLYDICVYFLYLFGQLHVRRAGQLRETLARQGKGVWLLDCTQAADRKVAPTSRKIDISSCQ